MKRSIALLISTTWSALALATPFQPELVQKFARGKSVKTNVFELEKLGLNKFMLPEQPWTSSYLPAKRGYGADPYAGRGSNPLFFKRNLKKSLKEMERYNEGKMTLDPAVIANLSTSDKYDLLIGNFKTNTSLTYRLFEMGDYIREQFNGLTFWTGMCHGWGPAATSSRAPLKTVRVQSVDGKYIIPFYPNDIKTLLTTAFANNTKAFVNDERIQTSSDPTRWHEDNIMPIVGNACRVKRPRLDSRTGRVSTNCEDVNPAFWHVTMLNMLGRHKQGLVVDIDHNEKVNNHPTAGYEIEYINLATLERSKSIQEALETIDDLPYGRGGRHPDIHYFVGVEMKVEFVDYQFFNKKNARVSKMQKLKDRSFVYALEINQQGDIVGGQWVNDMHESSNGDRRFTPGHKPDFIWYAPKGMKAPAYYESQATGRWEEGEPLPSSWATAAINASYQTNLDYASDADSNGNFPFRPQPEVIFKIAKRLLDLSR